MAQIQFDATTVAPDEGQLGAFPAGWYNVAIDQSEMKPTNDGSGAYLQLRFTVLDGDYKGRKVFTRLNLRNPNPVAVEIAYRQLSAICHAIGRLNIQDSSELHNAPLKVRVKVRPAQGEYEASNEISAYKNVNEVVNAPAGTSAPAPAPAAPTPPAPAPQQPWQAAPAPAAPAPAAPAAPAGAVPPWQQAPQQPWQQAPAAPAPNAQPQAPVAPPAPAAPAAPAGAVPPWQVPQQ